MLTGNRQYALNINEITIVSDSKELPNFSCKMIYSDAVVIQLNASKKEFTSAVQRVVIEEGARIAKELKEKTGLDYAIYYFVKNYHFYCYPVPF